MGNSIESEKSILVIDRESSQERGRIERKKGLDRVPINWGGKFGEKEKY